MILETFGFDGYDDLYSAAATKSEYVRADVVFLIIYNVDRPVIFDAIERFVAE